ncbi:hypothetical protein A1Q2_01162 [Trichosporon asahii var. asahii CBS 8904]|uniref:CBS domain-containing protein n=2 Tax=Trichosporon asahii var. asahii TaxID=189963 RepID=K1VK97_TRIAC|nr:hypothetical protein A1Q1_04938 [Trichosporon asahii var. asahii CBS 2479]EJT46449.1 hypothetical protein A1Q1_04938 [Trichosporon asahii var. asahii CBS 2479]EKD04590.1 hypothetical protein A1Q2_01162 [Trichosporon asahii var. asahii CBS 8904]
MDRETTPTPASARSERYRGAVVELPPAFCVDYKAPLSIALEKAYEREFDQLPRPIGYLAVPALKQKFERKEVNPSDPIASYMTHFPVSSKSHPYTVITPDTALENLEDFFNQKGTDFALVTDAERRWVLAVATRSDLETFVKRRGGA